jgi:hypothetical protein
MNTNGDSKRRIEDYCCSHFSCTKEKKSVRNLTVRLSAARKVRARNAFIVAAARKWRIGDSFMWV